ncbi:TPA: hypothetical protein DIV45_02820, partial [Patescibacteria group bacterium]
YISMNSSQKPSPKKEFPTQKSDEKIILILRKHWFVLAWPFFKGVTLILIVLFLPLFGKLGFYIFNSAFLTFLYLAWVVFWGNYIVYEYLNWYRDRFIITTKRVINIDQKSIFRRKVSEIELEHIQDISHEINGVSATTFGFGHVILASAGSVNIELRDIPQPAEVQDLIVKLVKDATAEPPVTAEELVDFIKQQRK